MRANWFLGLACGAAFGSFVGTASAAEALDVDGTDDASKEEGEDFSQKTDAEDDLDQSDATDAKAPSDEEWDPEKLQITLGVRYKMIIIPQFLINAFGVDGGTTLVTHGIGPAIGFAKRDFEIQLSPWFAGYHTGDMPFKGPSDGQDSWEIINSQLNAIYITADMTLRKEVAEHWDWTIGASGGLGIVFGTLYRNEAYWVPPYSPTNPGNNPNDPNQLAKCAGPGNSGFAGTPADVAMADAQCDNPGNYGPDPGWPVYPWLSFQTGVRYQPSRHFIARLDLGAGSSGFWLGLGADYGL